MPNGQTTAEDRVRVLYKGRTGTVPRAKLDEYVKKGATLQTGGVSGAWTPPERFHIPKEAGREALGMIRGSIQALEPILKDPLAIGGVPSPFAVAESAKRAFIDPLVALPEFLKQRGYQLRDDPGGALARTLVDVIALKAIPLPKRVPRVATTAGKLTGADVVIPMTVGERAASPGLEGLQRTLRQVPFVGKPLEKVVLKRVDAIKQFAQSVDADAAAEHSAGRELYKALEKKVPGYDTVTQTGAVVKAKTFTQMQQAVQGLRRARSQAFRKGRMNDVVQFNQALSKAEQGMEAEVLKQGGAPAAEAFKKANEFWNKYENLSTLRETIEDHIRGLPEVQQSIGAARPQAIRAGTLLEKLRGMQRTPYGDILTDAVGRERASQILEVTSLLDRATRSERFAYHLVRLGGVLATEVLLGGAVGGYFGSVVAGLLGTRVLASALVRFGGTHVLKGFLRAVAVDDVAEATRLGKILAAEAVADSRSLPPEPPAAPPAPPSAPRLPPALPGAPSGAVAQPTKAKPQAAESKALARAKDAERKYRAYHDAARPGPAAKKASREADAAREARSLEEDITTQVDRTNKLTKDYLAAGGTQRGVDEIARIWQKRHGGESIKIFNDMLEQAVEAIKKKK